MTNVNIDLYKNVSELFTDFGADKAIEILKSELGIEAKPVMDHRANDVIRYYMLNYDQIESPKTHPLVMQCRSLIVDANFGNTVSAKFERFFNIGEAPDIVGKIDITDSVIFDKDDGSLIGIWYDHISDRWEISTRSMAKADGPFELPNGKVIPWSDMVISTLFSIDPLTEEVDNTARELFQIRMDNMHLELCGYGFPKSETFIFEWVHPLNRIVTPYKQPAMILTGTTVADPNIPVGDVCIGDLEKIAKAFQSQFENVKMCGYFDSNGKTIEEIETVVAGLTDLKEGFVIRCNKTGIRAKIKSKTYVTAHRLRGEFAVPRDRDLIDLIRTNEVDEFIAYFPEWKVRITIIQSNLIYYDSLINILFLNSTRIDIGQKEFALTVQSMIKDGLIGSMAGSLLFNLRKGISTKTSIERMTKNKAFEYYQEIIKHLR